MNSYSGHNHDKRLCVCGGVRAPAHLNALPAIVRRIESYKEIRRDISRSGPASHTVTNNGRKTGGQNEVAPDPAGGGYCRSAGTASCPPWLRETEGGAKSGDP